MSKIDKILDKLQDECAKNDLQCICIVGNANGIEPIVMVGDTIGLSAVVGAAIHIDEDVKDVISLGMLALTLKQ